MTEWPLCTLCHTETARLDEHGLCPRISMTHDAVRRPDEWPADQHPELWALITSGKPVFPITAAEQQRLDERQRRIDATKDLAA